VSFGPLPADLEPYGAEHFDHVLRPNGHRPLARASEPSPEQASPDLLLRVRRLTWSTAALAENDEPVRAARIWAWDAARELARQNAPAPRPRFRLPGPLNRLLRGGST